MLDTPDVTGVCPLLRIARTGRTGGRAAAAAREFAPRLVEELDGEEFSAMFDEDRRSFDWVFEVVVFCLRESLGSTRATVGVLKQFFECHRSGASEVYASRVIEMLPENPAYDDYRSLYKLTVDLADMSIGDSDKLKIVRFCTPPAKIATDESVQIQYHALISKIIATFSSFYDDVGRAIDAYTEASSASPAAKMMWCDLPTNYFNAYLKHRRDGDDDGSLEFLIAFQRACVAVFSETGYPPFFEKFVPLLVKHTKWSSSGVFQLHLPLSPFIGVYADVVFPLSFDSVCDTHKFFKEFFRMFGMSEWSEWHDVAVQYTLDYISKYSPVCVFDCFALMFSEHPAECMKIATTLIQFTVSQISEHKPSDGVGFFWDDLLSSWVEVANAGSGFGAGFFTLFKSIGSEYERIGRKKGRMFNIYYQMKSVINTFRLPDVVDESLYNSILAEFVHFFYAPSFFKTIIGVDRSESSDALLRFVVREVAYKSRYFVEHIDELMAVEGICGDCGYISCYDGPLDLQSTYIIGRYFLTIVEEVDDLLLIIRGAAGTSSFRVSDCESTCHTNPRSRSIAFLTHTGLLSRCRVLDDMELLRSFDALCVPYKIPIGLFCADPCSSTLLTDHSSPEFEEFASFITPVKYQSIEFSYEKFNSGADICVVFNESGNDLLDIDSSAPGPRLIVSIGVSWGLFKMRFVKTSGISVSPLWNPEVSYLVSKSSIHTTLSILFIIAYAQIDPSVFNRMQEKREAVIDTLATTADFAIRDFIAAVRQ